MTDAAAKSWSDAIGFVALCLMLAAIAWAIAYGNRKGGDE